MPAETMPGAARERVANSRAGAALARSQECIRMRPLDERVFSGAIVTVMLTELNQVGLALPIFGILCQSGLMIVIGAELIEKYLADHSGHKGIKAARSQYQAWLDIASHARWRNPEDVKSSYPKASILKSSRVVFNIKGNDYRLVARVQYQAGVLAIRFFGTHAEYDKINAETV
jgi:mRNA interferase HigB